MSGCYESCLVADIGHISPSEAGSACGHLASQFVSVLLGLDGVQVNLEDGRSAPYSGIEKGKLMYSCSSRVYTS